MDKPLSPTICKLRSLPQPRQVWPKGTKQPLTKELATRFCDLIATSNISTAKLLAANPDLPPFKTLETWRYKFPWFNQLWKAARQRQAEHLMQLCLDEATGVTGKTAHAVRVKFDVYRFLASKFHPDSYGDKSQHHQSQTTVNVGISVPAERLTELRNKLDQSRSAFSATLPPALPPPKLRDKDELPVNGNANH